jgi:hypothetical protein
MIIKHTPEAVLVTEHKYTITLTDQELASLATLIKLAPEPAKGMYSSSFFNAYNQLINHGNNYQ